METRSIYRFARISPFKAREVTREIQGLPVQQALDLLAFTPKKAAVLVAKTLKSAVANAENNHQARPEALVVREAVVGEGPTLQRFQPKARGSAGPIRKRTSHIRIIVSDEIEIKTRESKKAGKKKTASKKPAAKKKTAAVKSESKPAAESPAPAETAAPAAEETK
ncbi:MAG: 50S ribosomal protein L22 [Chthoniobacterales bacterium]|nr:50S ribosomal protein L22 [Chthoniobacterales bacterium]